MSLLDKRSTGFLGYFFRARPGQSVLMVSLLLFSGLAEGIGVLTLLPILRIAFREGGARSGLDRAVTGLLGLVGLPASLPALLVLFVVAMGLKGILRWLAMRRVGATIASVAAELRLRLIRALMRARWTYFISQPAGKFANAVGTEAQRAAVAYQRGCTALAGVLQVAIYAAIIVLVSWKVAAAAVVVGVLTSLLFSRLVGISRQAGGRQTEVMKSLIASLSDALQGIKPIKAMGREGRVFPLLGEETRRLEEAERRQIVSAESLKSFQEPVLALVIAVGLYAAVTWGKEPISALLILTFLFYRILGRFNVLQEQYQTMTQGESAFWSMYEQSLEAEREQERSSGKEEPPSLEDGIVFESVSFGYDDIPVLRDVSFRIPAGGFVSIVGASGAGKTTLVDLLIGLHRPASGRILIDGVPLFDLDVGEWRRSVGYVPQDTVLLHASVLQNVTLGDESLDDSRVRRALEAAGAWGFVSSLPEGLHTVVGERGSKLSGGQRQRIAIARALVHRPKLLILDEATTGLDPETESAIRAALLPLRGRVTVVSISHQAAFRETADVVVEVTNGSVSQVRVRAGDPLRAVEGLS